MLTIKYVFNSLRSKVARVVIPLVACLIVLGAFALVPARPAQALGLCMQGASSKLIWASGSLHNVLDFNVGKYAATWGKNWQIYPKTVQVKLFNYTIITLGTSFWYTDKYLGYARFGINGNGIASLISSPSSFTVCWNY